MHNGNVEKVPDSEIAAYLKERLAQITIPKQLINAQGEAYDNQDYVDKVNYEKSRAHEGWNAVCSCGWEGNNPHPSEQTARDAIEAHYGAVENQLQGLGG